MRSAPSFWKAQRKRLLITPKGPWPSLTSLASITASLRAHRYRHHPPERRVKLPLKLQSAKRETCPAQSASSKRPRIMMGECTVTEDQKAIHGRGADGKGSDEGWVAFDRKVPILVRTVALAVVTTIALPDISSAAACRHFSIWHFPWPQSCPPKQIGQFIEEPSPPIPAPASPLLHQMRRRNGNRLSKSSRRN